MHSRRHNRSRWAHCNTPAALRRRRAAADALRDARAAALPPTPQGPDPLSLWQSIKIDLYVPTYGRCDQHATVIDGKQVGLLSATQISVLVREMILKRPSIDVLAEARRDCWENG
jgi:hypothetical protein